MAKRFLLSHDTPDQESEQFIASDPGCEVSHIYNR